MSIARRSGIFFGWRVVGAAFVLAVLGWGIGFYGPPIYLQAIQQNRGWPVALISTAVTAHFVVGAVVVANLPTLQRAFGIPNATKAGAMFLGCTRPRLGQRDRTLATLRLHTVQRRGLGSDGRGCSQRDRLSMVCAHAPRCTVHGVQGASIGGVVFSPHWAAGIGLLGLPIAAAAIGIVMALTVRVLADRLLSRTPQQMGLQPDNYVQRAPPVSATAAIAQPRLGSSLWHDTKFLTLSVGMALGLFAQIGLITHLFPC